MTAPPVAAKTVARRGSVTGPGAGSPPVVPRDPRSRKGHDLRRNGAVPGCVTQSPVVVHPGTQPPSPVHPVPRDRRQPRGGHPGIRARQKGDLR